VLAAALPGKQAEGPVARTSEKSERSGAPSVSADRQSLDVVFSELGREEAFAFGESAAGNTSSFNPDSFWGELDDEMVVEIARSWQVGP
jgi:hypothetical protein